MEKAGFNAVSFLWRWLFAMLLVLLTWNPSGYSWVSWFIEADSKVEAFLLLAGALLIVGWVVYVNATLQSLGKLGVILGAMVLGALLWVLIQYGLLSLTSASAVAWVVLIMVATLLGVGMSWSHIQRRVSGQVDVDDIERD